MTIFPPEYAPHFRLTVSVVVYQLHYPWPLFAQTAGLMTLNGRRLSKASLYGRNDLLLTSLFSREQSHRGALTVTGRKARVGAEVL